MQNKLQELTDKLYNEGLSKGKQEGEEILAKARKEAEEIVSAAKAEAEKIITQAEKEAAEISDRSSNDIRMASVQAISSVKQQLENAVIASAVRNPVKGLFSDKDFLKGIITTVVSAFNASDTEGKGLDIILPASVKAELGEKFEAEIHSLLKSGIDIRYSKGISGGFKAGPKDSGYQISFTDEDFSALIGDYLRPATKKILFG